MQEKKPKQALCCSISLPLPFAHLAGLEKPRSPPGWGSTWHRAVPTPNPPGKLRLSGAAREKFTP